MPVQAHPTRRKTRWSAPPPRPSAGTHAQPYRRRRPETTTLHRIVREHLETYLALANESDPMGDGVPDHVEKELRSYLKCGILAHVKNGRVTKIKGNPLDPLSRGRLCPRGAGGTGLLYDPDRLKKPMVRVDSRQPEVRRSVVGCGVE